jgi:hypothetical protein
LGASASSAAAEDVARLLEDLKGPGVVERLIDLGAEDDLLRSAGEYGLLFAFLTNSPQTQKPPQGEWALRVEDLTAMFKDGQLPKGWQTWPKRAEDWAAHVTALAIGAAKASEEQSTGSGWMALRQ